MIMNRFIFVTFIIQIILVLLYAIKYFINDADFCLDTGYCKEGMSLNTEYGQIVVNQESCIKHNGEWILNKKYCKFK